jgi:hypothetical protein
MITHQDDINLTDAHFFAKGDIHDLFQAHAGGGSGALDARQAQARVLVDLQA